MPLDRSEKLPQTATEVNGILTIRQIERSTPVSHFGCGCGAYSFVVGVDNRDADGADNRRGQHGVFGGIVMIDFCGHV